MNFSIRCIQFSRFMLRSYNLLFKLDLKFTKIYCGHCKSKMNGTGGNSGHGDRKRYSYYTCKGKCGKRNEKKEDIEQLVLEECYKLLTDDWITAIAKKTAELSRDDSIKKEIRRLERNYEKNQAKIENLLDMIESGDFSDSITKRIREREEENKEIELKIKELEHKDVVIDEDLIILYLRGIRERKIDTEEDRAFFIDTLVEKVYVYDGKLKVILKLGDEEIDIDTGSATVAKEKVRVEPKMVYHTALKSQRFQGFLIFKTPYPNDLL